MFEVRVEFFNNIWTSFDFKRLRVFSCAPHYGSRDEVKYGSSLATVKKSFFSDLVPFCKEIWPVCLVTAVILGQRERVIYRQRNNNNNNNNNNNQKQEGQNLLID
jgi:hypothetical protein